MVLKVAKAVKDMEQKSECYGNSSSYSYYGRARV